MLRNERFNLSDYIAGEESVIKNMTLEQHQLLANKYLDPSKWLTW